MITRMILDISYNDSKYKVKVNSGSNRYFLRSVLKADLRNCQFEDYNMRHADTQFLTFNLHDNWLLWVKDFLTGI